MTGSATAQEVIRRVVTRIVEGYRPEKVILFGSYVHGAPTVPVSPLVYTPAELCERLAIRDYFIEDVLKTGEVVHG